MSTVDMPAKGLASKENGEEMTKETLSKNRNDIRMTLFKSLRILPLMHNWTFWYDK